MQGRAEQEPCPDSTVPSSYNVKQSHAMHLKAQPPMSKE